MEFVRVLYPHERNVEIDNTIVGKTNQVLLVETGTHRIDLGEPVDYEPQFKVVDVVGTIPANPMGILFDVVVVTAATTPTPMSVAGGETPIDEAMTRGSME